MYSRLLLAELVTNTSKTCFHARWSAGVYFLWHFYTIPLKWHFKCIRNHRSEK